MPACMRWARCRPSWSPDSARQEVALLAAAEFAIHYAIDFTKAGISRRSHAGPDSRAYWALHGADQLMHQLTYVGLVVAALV